MYSAADTPKGWLAPFGHPRINACSRLPVAFRSVPRPSSPPGAKASHRMPFSCSRTLKAPSQGPHSMHRNHPQITTDRPIRGPADDPAHAASRSAHNTHAPEHEPGCWRPDTADRSATPNPPVRHRNQARPETHQNLIYPDKEQNAHPEPGTHSQARPIPPPNGDRNQADPKPSLFSAIAPKPDPTRWWRRWDSNPRPPACKAGALPAELRPQTGGPSPDT